MQHFTDDFLLKALVSLHIPYSISIFDLCSDPSCAIYVSGRAPAQPLRCTWRWCILGRLALVSPRTLFQKC